jgi:arsenate reductase
VAKVTLYHNPRCSKSRQALALLEAEGVDLEIVNYLDASLDEDTLRVLIASSDSAPREFVRTGDRAFEEAGLSLDADADVDTVAVLLAAHPEVMQRPVVSCAGKTRIGRPPERVLEIVRARA